ncbi:amino acid adenylation domain-containing protein [Streptomyces sp. PTM05]|uniref:Amino acid adenylation domain-containing protein n=1 Tax=Streptantibioticus parmotrematis TaxID=2873249 RepID=A0ABS7QKS5_9ACTN|nr:amino acid adenylation domain-containing protein [Streptantibioticus parmotrematis]MBY8883735.1 amino acid adenylation domain-containing protein [Streptantibioticus parmotrematis]
MTDLDDAGDIRLDGLLAAAAVRHPDRPALEGEGRTWTWSALEAEVRVLAAELAAHGVTPGVRVGVYAPKTPATVIALYAALRAGAVVAPLDVADPAARTARMIRNAGISVLLTTDRAGSACRAAADAAREGRHPGAPREGELPNGLNWIEVVAQADRPAPLPAPADAGGYVLFTSGSTGWPKGVLLSHANVAHYALWAAREFALTPDDRIGSQAALTFDLTTFDLFSAAAAGACTVVLPDVLRSFARDVVTWLGERRITAFMAVPSLYHNMLRQGGFADAVPASLRVAAFGGEPFVPDLLQECLRLLGDRPFYNLYGPTETNACTYHRVPSDWSADQEMTIGRGIGGVHIEVLDEQGCPTDGDGEIHVAGPTVFQGYLRDGELSDPTVTVAFRDGVTRRAYATGDIARITADGRVFLRGRRDSQVKRRGHRIDLLDVENAALELDQVVTAAAVAKDGDHSGEIWVYAQTTAGERELLAALRGALPKRMLPDRVVPLAALPTTVSGKVDRRALGAAAFPSGSPTESRILITQETSA